MNVFLIGASDTGIEAEGLFELFAEGGDCTIRKGGFSLKTNGMKTVQHDPLAKPFCYHLLFWAQKLKMVNNNVTNNVLYN